MVETLITTKRIEIINNKEFIKAVLDQDMKGFVIYDLSLNLRKMSIHPTYKAQIVLLIAEKASIFAKYLNFRNVFSKKSEKKLFKYFHLSKHSIDLK